MQRRIIGARAVVAIALIVGCGTAPRRAVVVTSEPSAGLEGFVDPKRAT